MTVTARTLRSRTEQALEDERQELLDSLSDTRVRIQQAYGSFNAVSDPDLIESFVYEIASLQKRYSYLLRRVKALDATAEPEPSAALPG